MNPQKGGLAPGLYLVSTPLGNARDITLRALDILRDADVLAAEDTRALRRLMEIHGVALGDRPLLAYHDHNGARMRPRLLGFVADGASVAYASEAGTPMISDPGFDLARAVVAEGGALTAAPGPSAVIAALTLAGLPTDRFFFAGFLPNAAAARVRGLEALQSVPGTLVFYESPKRLVDMLKDCATVLGADRQAAVCREITKKFEECRRGTPRDLADHYANHPPKGEIVVLVGTGTGDVSEVLIESSLTEALTTMSVRDAAEFVSKMYGRPKRPIYQAAMKLAGRT